MWIVGVSQVPELQLPIRFATPVGGELMESLPGVGRSMSVSFNRCMNPSVAEQVTRTQWTGVFLCYNDWCCERGACCVSSVHGWALLLLLSSWQLGTGCWVQHTLQLCGGVFANHCCCCCCRCARTRCGLGC
jgi:hypothetical protein